MFMCMDICVKAPQNCVKWMWRIGNTTKLNLSTQVEAFGSYLTGVRVNVGSRWLTKRRSCINHHELCLPLIPHLTH